jgi:hypothetical protein
MPVEPATKPSGPAHVGLQSVDWIGSLVIVVCLTAAIALARRDLVIAPVAGSPAPSPLAPRCCWMIKVASALERMWSIHVKKRQK